MKDYSFEEFGRLKAKSLFKKISLQMIIVLVFVFTITSHYYFTSSVDKTSLLQEKNLSYLLQIGDSFSVNRILKSIKDSDSSMNLFIYNNSSVHFKTNGLFQNNDFIKFSQNRDGYFIYNESLYFSKKSTIFSKGMSQSYTMLQVVNIPIAKILFFALIIFTFVLVLLKYSLYKSNQIASEITYPLNNFVKKLSSLNSQLDINKINVDNYNIKEMKDLGKTLKDFSIRISEHEKREERADLAFQVAHDIQSPLIALKNVLEKKSDLNSAFGLINKIQKISEDLLVSSELKVDTNLVKVRTLYESIKRVVSEKHLELGDDNKVKILFEYNICDKNIQSSVIINSKELERIISNLINNAIESIHHSNGKVTLFLECSSDEFSICVKDNGDGISKADEFRIFEKGFSGKNKKSSGLGLYHAKKKFDSWSGDIIFSSESGEGSIFTLVLPLYKNNKVETNLNIYHIEDNSFFRDLWVDYNESRKRNIKSFNSVLGFENIRDVISKENSIVVLDQNLNSNIKGSDYAKKLNLEGFKNIVLSTGDAEVHLIKLPFLKGIIGKDPKLLDPIIEWMHLSRS